MQELPQPPCYKQVLVVRKDLNMRKGKIGAQVGHGVQLALALGATVNRETCEVVLHLTPEEFAWMVDQDYKKICVSVNSESELLQLHQQALDAGLRCALVIDNGHTEFKGVKTATVLAIGPAHPAQVDALTAQLPLL